MPHPIVVRPKRCTYSRPQSPLPRYPHLALLFGHQPSLYPRNSTSVSPPRIFTYTTSFNPSDPITIIFIFYSPILTRSPVPPSCSTRFAWHSIRTFFITSYNQMTRMRPSSWETVTYYPPFLLNVSSTLIISFYSTIRFSTSPILLFYSTSSSTWVLTRV